MTVMAFNSSEGLALEVQHFQDESAASSKTAAADVSLQELLKPMLPPGAPIPDFEQLDYSFAIEYRGPPVNHPVPKAEAVDAKVVGPRKASSALSSEQDAGPRLARLKPAPLQISRKPSTTGSLPGSGKTSPLSVEGSKNRTSSSAAAGSLRVGHVVEVEMQGTGKKQPLRERPSPLPDAEMDEDVNSRLPDSPDSGVSLRMMNSSLHSYSQKSSSSEIEELNVQFSAAVSAAASALPSPSALRSVSVSHGGENFASHSTPRSMSVPAERAERPGALPVTHSTEAVPVVIKKKRECHRCHKGHLLQDKETCLACTAKYCRNCVLIAMGSMPEGRKCLGCIGQSIHESRRPFLGKPSRLLKNLLNPLEVQQILKSEKECLANQLRPEQLYINGRPLNMQAMSEMLGCSNPPSKLKPGRYWYDKSSGFWGQEGEKPCQIVTAELKIGGDLKCDASGGSTQVYINGREITTSELKMLKLAGIQCPQNTYLFLSPDGSYMEEGQNNVKGNIWDKATVRIMYALFSLPTPRGTARVNRGDGRAISSRYLPAILEQKTVSRLLLLGHEGSGRSTIFKQAKFLYKNGFDRRELESYKEMIQSYLYKYLVNLLEGRERFEEEVTLNNPQPSDGGEGSKNVYSMETRLKNLADWFLDITADGSLERYFPAATREYAASVEELWRDPALQATYRRKEELHLLPDVAGDFLERAIELSSNEYEPVDHDVLYAEGLTQGSGLADIEFELPDREQISGAVNDTSEYSSSGRFQLIRVGGIGFNEGKKWLGMFEDVRAVIFCAALSEFDQLWMNTNGVLQNKMLLSKDLFQDIVGRPCFKGIPFVLFLNKYDKFEEKIARGVPLTTCEWFSDFSPVGVPLSVQAQQAYTYIVHKFKRLVGDRKLYTFQLNALDRNLVASAFQYVKHILRHEDCKAAGWMMLPEDSSFCTDLSSYSMHSTAARQENCGSSLERSERHGFSGYVYFGQLFSAVFETI